MEHPLRPASGGFWGRFRSEFGRRLLGRGGAGLIGLGIAMIWFGVRSSDFAEWLAGVGVGILGYLALARVERWWPFRQQP